MDDLSKSAMQEWVSRRAFAVRRVYTAYDVLREKGIEEVPDESTPTQIACPFHGQDNKPSARYYPRSGNKHDYVRCFKCRENWDCVNLYAKFRGVRFMDALSELERRFRIKTPQRPEIGAFTDPAERGSGYVSAEWRDVPRVLSLLERKVMRAKDRCGMVDFVKLCRVLDAVAYDFDKEGKSTPEMAAILKRAQDRVDEVSSLPDDLAFGPDDHDGTDNPG